MPNNILSICKIHVNIGKFAEGADFQLFQENNGKKNSRVSLIFGRNGAGKSTIARQIVSLSSDDGNDKIFLDKDGNQIPLSPEEKTRIRVFDEQYVQEKILIKEKGLENIVMLGDQVLARKRIDEIDEKTIELGRQNVLLVQARADLEEGTHSVEKIYQQAKEVAKDGGWTERYRQIEGGRPNLTPERWNRILSAQNDSSRQQLQEYFNQMFDKYTKAKNLGTTIMNTVPQVDATRYDEQPFFRLMSQQLDEPVLSEREKHILNLAQTGDQGLIEDARAVFSNEQTDVCPMCLQSVTAEYKASLVESITKVLNDDVDHYKANLKSLRFSKIEENEFVLSGIPGDMLTNYHKAVRSVNNIIEQYNVFLEKRLNSLFIPITVKPLGLCKAINLLNEEVAKLNSEIQSLNHAVKDRDKIKNELLRISDQIAWIDAKDRISAGKEAEVKLEKTNDDLEEVEKSIDSLRRERDGEEAKLKKTEIAAKKINAYLANVYFDKDRFRLVPTEGMYKIQVRGESVPPNKVSTGERNVLALCYFFSESGKGKFEGSEDNEAQYIVLDDPISSFDMENEVGICALIRERASHILDANEDSRITILTHNTSVMQELSHVFDDINSAKTKDKRYKIDYFELHNGKMEKSDYPSKRKEYTVLLDRAYRYAKSTQEDSDESFLIGNILRRILEGYCTFNYGIGMGEICHDEILRTRCGEAYDMLSNAMYRLILNDGSHFEERVASLDSLVTFNRYSYQEKRTMAQCVFVILNYLDKDHIAKQLAGVSKEELRGNISKWQRQFKAS